MTEVLDPRILSAENELAELLVQDPLLDQVEPSCATEARESDAAESLAREADLEMIRRGLDAALRSGEFLALSPPPPRADVGSAIVAFGRLGL